MKQIVQVLSISIILFLSASCHAQMMRQLSDAKKLQLNKEQFIGKQFKLFLEQIGPEIKFAYGNPENKGEGYVGTNIKLFFIDKDTFFKKKRASEEPTGILVRFILNTENTKKPIPVGGVNIIKEELIHLYGEMVIRDIYVTGKN